MALTRVLIIDGQTLFREALAVLLAVQGECTIVGEAEDAASGTLLAVSHHPDVIVTELCLPDSCGAEVIARILAANGDARVVALTTIDDEDTVAATVAAGAQGYLLKCRHADDVVRDIRTVSNGGAALDPIVAPIIWRRFQQLVRHSESGKSGRLLPFEQEVLTLLVNGKSTRQIARTLSTTPAVVENALADVCEKLHARNRTHAAVIAMSRGLVKT